MKVPNKQKGLALLMLVFVLVLAVTTYSIKILNTADVKDAKGKKTAEALAEAKAALIGWSVSHPVQPGIMPFPDRSTDSNYDGNSDCFNANPGFDLLLGRLPFLGQTAPCTAPSPGLASNLSDGDGEQLWYAVSRNLIRSSIIPVINPSTADASTESWLIVRGKNGQIISDRVAAVIMAAGAPVGIQDRSGGLAGPAEYLDRITIFGVSYGNDDYTTANESFVISDEMQVVSSSDPRYLQPYEFNDKLTYITIDELMLALEKRAIGEVALGLRAYNLANGYYPYAATLGDPTNACDNGSLQGGIPLADCGPPTPSLSLAGILPSWFTDNRWQDFMYYTVASDCHLANTACLGDITVGTQTTVDALVISTGAAITPQIRPSALTANYLDSTVNADGDSIYDAVGTGITNIYNDQMLIVAP